MCHGAWLKCNPVLNATHCEPAFWRLNVIFMTELLYKMIAFGLKLRPAGFLWVCWFSAFLLHTSKPCHTAASYSTCTGIFVSFRIKHEKNLKQGNCRECPEKCCLCSAAIGLVLNESRLFLGVTQPWVCSIANTRIMFCLKLHFPRIILIVSLIF